jgi:hypothetical protein
MKSTPGLGFKEKELGSEKFASNFLKNLGILLPFDLGRRKCSKNFHNQLKHLQYTRYQPGP